MRNAVILAMILGFVACAESPTQAVDSAPPLSAALAPAGHGPVVGSASGSGHSLCTDDGAVCNSQPGDDALRTFSVTAQLHADGTVRGKAQVNNRGRPLAWKADVECMLFRSASDKPNQVWMFGTLTSGYGQASDSPTPFPYVEGARVLFAVEDNGEGSSATPDRLVGFATVPEGQYQALCPVFNQQIEPFPLDGFFGAFSFAPIRGNIQVRSPN
ncbi:MAG: hypothetical protein ACI9OJ_004792 [Myxococcota bacterium]|jgi:hypothetical protein